MYSPVTTASHHQTTTATTEDIYPSLPDSGGAEGSVFFAPDVEAKVLKADNAVCDDSRSARLRRQALGDSKVCTADCTGSLSNLPENRGIALDTSRPLAIINWL